MDIMVVLMELNFHHLMVVDICVLDHMTKLFVYGILKHQNHYMFLMDMKVLFGVLIFHHYKAITKMKIIIIIKMNNIGVIGGNGYTICSGSYGNIIRIWDIETTKQFNVFEEHTDIVRSVKYGSNELINTILSGSYDKSVRLWDIRSGKQIQVFNGHTNWVWSVEYSPFVIKNSSGNPNVICSGSWDNTIRFWDTRSNKNELYMIKGDYKKDREICCLKFIKLKKKEKTKNITYDLNLCYGSLKGPICIWG
ncbi:hypothetical protein RFI_29937 [Reticulomyxa filosa]|uniref:Uncharacterized protein n=1 Tax=Reticulomyxa filosa TaxID=46433 RepID=X6M356_RETFI|nr:hypothetical protein RFI_29937 [Reticulomyxa filosa]|eukprot:ETO07455.1 hypothetical protein RFI_29937 [Reticulomyxa filosa]